MASFGLFARTKSTNYLIRADLRIRHTQVTNRFFPVLGNIYYEATRYATKICIKNYHEL